jgi:uncharacterized membrane protein
VETAFLDINNRGQIIGGYADIEGTVTYFLLDGGVFTPIKFPGASLTVPLDINNRGQIVGWLHRCRRRSARFSVGQTHFHHD